MKISKIISVWHWLFMDLGDSFGMNINNPKDTKKNSKIFFPEKKNYGSLLTIINWEKKLYSRRVKSFISLFNYNPPYMIRLST